jgi:hypothetical protein
LCVCSYHKVFDSNLQTELINNFQDIPERKLAEIVGSVYNMFIEKEEAEKQLLKHNI